MIRDALRAATDFVAQHNRITLVVMLVVSGLVLAGIPQLDTGSEAGADEDAFSHLERVQKAEYVQANYNQNDETENRSIQPVYVWQPDGDALSRTSLLEELRYQQAILDSDAVQSALHEDGVTGFSNLVAQRLAEGENPDLSAQIAALDSASDEEVEQVVAATLSEDPRAARFLPTDHDPSETSSTDARLLVALDASVPPETYSDARKVLYDEAEARSDAGFFRTGEHAINAYNAHFFTQMTELVLPAALLVILFVLAFSYRDLVDIVVGMAGVVLAIAWMFGIMGWMGVAAGTVSIIPVVLITGLSIDFGFHVFNRYREQRGPEEGIREPMARGTRLVATALVLVTVTAAIGFLSNLTNPLGQIRNLGISITLGVVSAFVIFLTVVPALKISVDGVLERFGFDRRKQALGQGRYLRPALQGSVTLARRAAPVVLVVAVLVGAAGGLAWTQLDKEQFDQNSGEIAEWKQQLPGPVGWETADWPEQSEHVDSTYQPASAADAVRSQILVEGEVTSDAALADVEAGVERIRERDGSLLVSQPGTQAVRSPVTEMRRVAERDEAFAAEFADADGNDDGVPDRNLEALYDAFYEADEDAASRVVERTDSGEYRSVLVTLYLDTDWTERPETVATLEAGESEMEANGLAATVAGQYAIIEDVLDELTAGIVQTMIVALTAIVVVLALVFRIMHGSASLGAVVAIPIALVVGMVIGGMYLLDLPLNLLTALLMSLVIGLGVDYNIHLGDRFADERREGKTTYEALDAAVTGTGGALLGSTLTSIGAFSALVLVPNPGIQGFATIVVVALGTAFVVSVLVLPSILALWSRFMTEPIEASGPTEDIAPQD